MLNDYLTQLNLAESTKAKYADILSRADTTESAALLAWIHARIDVGTPLGTLLPIRAAVRHYLVGVLGYDEVLVQAALPPTVGVAPERVRPSLEQLALYHAAVEQIKVEPARTILSLILLTGMPLSKLVRARREDLTQIPDGRLKLFEEKLNQQASRLLAPLLLETDGWLFPGYSGKHITSHAIRKYTRQIGRDYPELAGIEPRYLREGRKC